MYIKMESPKYLIIITLIDGQNFTVPDGALDKIEASVFAEARFGNESILKSDPIKLTNSNPEFVTELAWQLDKKSLHQLRVERKSIKLQIFMQTKERVKGSRQQNNNGQSIVVTNGLQTTDSNSTNKVELIGYTIIDIRSAQEREQPKFQWLPLLNPKFRKPLYNRPEIQLAVYLSRINENPDEEASPSTSTCVKADLRKKLIECSEWQSSSHESEQESLNDDKLYKTCLDFTMNSDQVEKDEIIENDINIISKDGRFYMYDKRNPEKSTIEDCDERYTITVTMPFMSNLETLVKEIKGSYYFSVSFLGSIKRTNCFEELTSVDTKEVEFEVRTTDSSVLSTYFGLNSNLDIKLHKSSGESVGIATIQLDQLCSFDTKRRSIEGIFAIQSMQDHDIPSAIHPSIGVSVVIERISTDILEPESILVSDKHIELAKEHFGDEIDDYLYKTLNDTHQLTLEVSEIEHQIPTKNAKHDLDIGDIKEDDHHFCFTIDLKNFSYNQNQRLIPTLRELLVRYSYPFFGYKDTITTDASIPISPTTSIIVSGFCEFNFATTKESLLNALKEIPLNLEILTCEQTKRVDLVENQEESVVALCNLNLAQTLGLSQVDGEDQFPEDLNTTIAAPIYALNGDEIGELQIYLCLKDLGRPSFNFKASVENIDSVENVVKPQPSLHQTAGDPFIKVDAFIRDMKNNFESWKEDFCNKLTDEIRKRENERYKRLLQRFEAKDAKREQEFRRKIDELNNLENRYKNSLSYVETLERKLSNSFEQLKTKDALLDSRLDTLDLKISKAISNIKNEYEKRLDSLPIRRYSDETQAETKSINRFVASKPSSDVTRRLSLRNTNTNAGIPVPIRSTSLVRNATEGSSTRFVKRPTGVVTTVINGTSLRPRSNSTRHTLSKETQEKLANLRREKAELLKRGCRPNDELIQEINSLIEKLAC